MKNKKGLRLIAVVEFFTLLVPAFACAWTVGVPRTGQTACFDSSGKKISCVGTQDGAAQAGIEWPDPRFTDRCDGTISDNLTGLVWTRDANLSRTYMDWIDALSYVAGMNAGLNTNFGYTDWRLPNVNELASLFDYQFDNPALPQSHPFTNVQTDLQYWSSTTYAGKAETAFYLDMSVGFVYFNDKTSGYAVWPVRAGKCGEDYSAICLPRTGQTTCYTNNGTTIDCDGTGQDGAIQAGAAWPTPRFIDNNDETVTDKLTGLMWAKNRALCIDYWQKALDYVNALTIGGHGDWRLPNVNELRSLVDYGYYNSCLPPDNPFTGASNFFGYWKSTSSSSSAFSAFAVSLYGGGVTTNRKSVPYPGGIPNYVWPVRSGNSITTTTIPSGTCPATNILGECSPQLEELRSFRDDTLGKSVLGRKIIELYYSNAESIQYILNQNPLLITFAKTVIKTAAPVLRD